MNRSQCFEHDIEVRNAWVSQLSEADKTLIRGDQKTNAGGMEVSLRFQLYKDIDGMVKEKYLETITELNKDMERIHIKGLGPTRQAKDQMPSDLRLMAVAAEVLAELDFVELTKLKPVVEENTESVSE